MSTQHYSHTALSWALAGLFTVPCFAASNAIALDPTRGAEIGAVYQSWLSPHQEGGEEAETPKLVPKQFRSTTPSVDRNLRKSAGHGVLRFSRDLSRAYVELQISGVDPKTITMFHIHCGKPGILGPIIVDFALKQDLHTAFPEGRFNAEIRNEDIVAVASHRHDGLIAFATAGCPINKDGNPNERVKTVAGLASIAREGELYFNVHTTGQNYFGEMRGQIEVVP
jgi:CHRD domain